MKNEFVNKTVKLVEIEEINNMYSVVSYKEIDEFSRPIGDTLKLVCLTTNISSICYNVGHVEISYPTNFDPKAIVVR